MENIINEILQKFGKRSIYKDYTTIVQYQKITYSTNLKVNVLKMMATQLPLKVTFVFVYKVNASINFFKIIGF